MVMSLELLLRSGAVAVGIDRDTSVIVFECDEHRIQQAIPLRRDNLPDLIQDFLTRHGSCDGIASKPGVGGSRTVVC